ncbi:MAG: hypothetical protein JKY52_19900 [Flavobacteriales bacterium]|nr:hypothetical protein [Flavobacteriales bacterium]
MNKIMVINKLYRGVICLAALLACGGSLVCSVALFVLEQSTPVGQVLAGVFATSLELCKFAFFPVGVALYCQYGYKKRAASFVTILLGCVLLTVSICASVGFFESASATFSTRQTNESFEHKALKQSLESIDRQMNTINTVAEGDADNNFRKNAAIHLKPLSELRAEKERLLLNARNTPAVSSVNTSAAFLVISNVTGIDMGTVRHWSFIAVAILIDVCGIYALLLVQGNTPLLADIKPPKPKDETENETENDKLIRHFDREIEKMYGGCKPPANEKSFIDWAGLARLREKGAAIKISKATDQTSSFDEPVKLADKPMLFDTKGNIVEREPVYNGNELVGYVDKPTAIDNPLLTPQQGIDMKEFDQKYISPINGLNLRPVVEKMLAGCYGDKLSIKPICSDWPNLKLRYEHLRHLLEQLIDENHVVKKGKFYLLRQQVIA